jgi:hypothetical protein
MGLCRAVCGGGRQQRGPGLGPPQDAGREARTCRTLRAHSRTRIRRSPTRTRAPRSRLRSPKARRARPSPSRPRVDCGHPTGGEEKPTRKRRGGTSQRHSRRPNPRPSWRMRALGGSARSKAREQDWRENSGRGGETETSSALVQERALATVEARPGSYVTSPSYTRAGVGVGGSVLGRAKMENVGLAAFSCSFARARARATALPFCPLLNPQSPAR